MRFGLSSYAYRWSIGIQAFTPSRPMDVRQFVNKAFDLHVDGVQICDNLRLQDLSTQQLKDIREIAGERGMFLETGARGSNPHYLANMLKVTHQLGSGILRVVTKVNRTGPKQDIRSQIDRIVQEIKEVLYLAKDLDIRLALENHANLSSEELLSIINAVDDDHVRVCLDTMNSIVLMEHPLQTARMLGPYAISAHLKDFRIDKLPDYHRIEGVPLGEGFVNFSQIMQILKENNLDPSIHLELYIDRKESEQETLLWEDDCVVRSLNYARKYLLEATLNSTVNN